MEELRRQRDLAQSQVDELRQKLQDEQQVALYLSVTHICVVYVYIYPHMYIYICVYKPSFSKNSLILSTSGLEAI